MGNGYASEASSRVSASQRYGSRRSALGSPIGAWRSQADLDSSLIGENDRVLQISIGHLLGEEFAFDFVAGRNRPA